MALFFYSLAIRLYAAGIWLAAPFHHKARLWVQGRRNWRSQFEGLSFDRVLSPKVLWIHAASLGEFEQGRPIMEAVRVQFPEWKIVLSFFSPSGFEVRKNYPYADVVCYLPMDTHRNAADFLDRIKPDAAIFVKYEFWAHYLFALKKRSIPTLLVSALFREKQTFFRWYGNFWRQMLGCFTHFFLQDEASAKLLQGIGFENWTVAGDTRVDRVLTIAEGAAENEIAQAFSGTGWRSSGKTSNPVLVVGSSWAPDEAVLAPLFQSSDFQKSKMLLAPHEPSEANVARLCSQFKDALRYSQATPETASRTRCLLIDNVGMLNTLYRYGTVAYIGGGFGKGIHNTLEPAAFGLPIIFGPKYALFEEARQFVARGGAFCVRDTEELMAVFSKLLDPIFYQTASDAVRAYLEESKGATNRVLGFLSPLFEPEISPL